MWVTDLPRVACTSTVSPRTHPLSRMSPLPTSARRARDYHPDTHSPRASRAGPTIALWKTFSCSTSVHISSEHVLRSSPLRYHWGTSDHSLCATVAYAGRITGRRIHVQQRRLQQKCGRLRWRQSKRFYLGLLRRAANRRERPSCRRQLAFFCVTAFCVG